MKKIICLIVLLLLSNTCLAASSSGGSDDSKESLYKGAKKLILSSLNQKGISVKNIKISIDSKVTGPTYQADATSNKVVYEKYQYIFMNYKKSLGD